MNILHELSGVLRTHLHDTFSVLLLLLCLIVAWFKPLFCSSFFDLVERGGAALARRKRLALVLIAAATILIRLSMLWAIPIPVPHVHDEFSYLLAGDTFAHGRLTNPAHPHWIFFDTIHVNQHPTYMSKYPPGQGAVLAVGELLGNPWFGVLLSVAVMCAAVLWMLQGWMPAHWALLGGIFVMFRVGIFSSWMNSYWGGAVAAIGGALVVGALPRIMRFSRTRDALLLTLGAAILGNSRPLEGLILCLPVGVALLAWFFSAKSPSWRTIVSRIILPICAAGILCGLFMGYYNWRGTGSPTLFPYVVNERAYLSTPTLFWEKVRPPMHYSSPQLDAFYNVFARDVWFQSKIDGIGSAAKVLSSDIIAAGTFFFWPELLIPLLAIPWVFRDRRFRLLLLQMGISVLGMLLVPWFQPHYAAPLTATLFALPTQGMRHLRRIRIGSRPIGVGLSRAVVFVLVLLSPHYLHVGPLSHWQVEPIDSRAVFERQLEQTPGAHLVIVRYDETANRGGNVPEWVYNGADIDHSRIVWAREIPGVDLQPLLDYFRGRRVWVVEPDAVPPRLTPFEASSGK